MGDDEITALDRGDMKLGVIANDFKYQTYNCQRVIAMSDVMWVL
jgi:hypothetical protein